MVGELIPPRWLVDQQLEQLRSFRPFSIGYDPLRTRNPMPRFVLFPRVERAQRAAERFVGRCRDAVEAFRHGLSAEDW